MRRIRRDFGCRRAMDGVRTGATKRHCPKSPAEVAGASGRDGELAQLICRGYRPGQTRGSYQSLALLRHDTGEAWNFSLALCEGWHMGL